VIIIESKVLDKIKQIQGSSGICDDMTVVRGYCDGGLIGPNSKGTGSVYGGTWAYVLVNQYDQIVSSAGGIVYPNMYDVKGITNNVSEMYAMWKLLGQMPDRWSGDIYTDSMITAGRLFLEYGWRGVPSDLRTGTMAQRRRLGRVTFHLLDGHPTTQELINGVGSRGHPVSIFNVMCDDLCNEFSAKFKIDNFENGKFVGPRVVLDI